MKRVCVQGGIEDPAVALLDVSMTMSAVTSAGLFSPTLGFLTSMMVYSAMGAAIRAHPLNPI